MEKKQILSGRGMMLLAGLMMLPLHGPAQTGQTIIPGLENKIESWYQRYPQQKIHLHLDRDAYMAGEDIWYRAFLLDARTHRPDTISKNLVVELVNSYGTSTSIQLLKLNRGFAHGDFRLPDTLREGLYKIRAYTNWMRNWGSDYFFEQSVNIWNPDNYLNLYRDDKQEEKRLKRQSRRLAENTDVRFFPEGGELVDGLPTTVGFKAVNELGVGVQISGRLTDRKGNTLVDFESNHLGMGAFPLTPDADMDYRVEIRRGEGRPLKPDFPEVLEAGFGLHLLSRDDEGINLRLQSSSSGPRVLLVAQMRGNLEYVEQLELQDGSAEVRIPTGEMSQGVLQLTLFDSQREPRCERLVFIHNDDRMRVAIVNQKETYGRRERVELTLLAHDGYGEPIQGHFSLSVSDRDLENNAGDFQAGILSNMLLNAEIAGPIENPDHYLRKNDPEARQDLDYLLLTQGWRRFVWENVINESSLNIQYPIQQGILVAGRITSEIFERPLKNIRVTLTVLSEFNDVYVDRTDDDGEFQFELPDYEDTIRVEIKARRRSGRKNLLIHLQENGREESERIYSTYASEKIVRGTNRFRPPPEEEPDSMETKLSGIYGTPDHVLYVDESMRTYSNVFEMIQGRFPGVQVTGNDVLIRGRNTIMGDTQPLYLIDNVPTDAGAVAALNPQDIERIEVLSGPSAAIYGVRGANGVIAIYTHRGRFMIKGQITFDMLGYHRPREFYSPTYGTRFDDLVEDHRTTLYWNPDIRTDVNGQARITFYNSDKSTEYYIRVEGIDESGRIGSNLKSYRVE